MPRKILTCLDKADVSGTFLLDSATALLSNEMFFQGGVDEAAPRRVADELAEFAGRVRDLVIVSDYIYSDADRYDDLTELYRQGLALADRRLAACCDTVLELCIGQMTVHKGGLPV
jgi:adenosylcobinamide kinase/adenosylcobinamide-phosphate guanylyltransferase